MTIILQIEIIVFCVLLSELIVTGLFNRKHKYLVVFQAFDNDNKNNITIGSEMFSFKKKQLNLSFIRELENDIVNDLHNSNVKATKVIIINIIKLN